MRPKSGYLDWRTSAKSLDLGSDFFRGLMANGRPPFRSRRLGVRDCDGGRDEASPA
jgi:hypothetical protein